MTRLLAGEMIKVRTTRTALGFAAAALLLAVAATLIPILAGDITSIDQKKNLVNFGGGLGIVLLLFGAVGATGEFRHRTLAPAVLIAPDRFRLVLARLLAYMLTALLVGIAISIVVLAITLPLLPGEPGPSLSGNDYVKLIAGGIIDVVLAAGIGVGAGTLIRNQVAAVVGALVWLTILEPLVGVIDDSWTHYTIGSTLNRVGLGGDHSMAWLPSIGLLVLWTAVWVGAAIVVDRRRDVD
jgi:ABC-2 type transport system permease protein